MAEAGSAPAVVDLDPLPLCYRRSVVWLADLTRLEDTFVAVGWLGAGVPFTRGEVARDVLTKLAVLSRHGFEPMVSRGVHSCDLCASSEGAQRFVSRNIVVPGEGVVFFAPAMIDHYIEIHGYAPPPVFCRAVMACPPPRTLAYFRALTASGPADWRDPGCWSGHFDPASMHAADDDLAELDGLWERGFDVAFAAVFAYAARRDVEATLVWLRRAHRDGALDAEDVASDARLDLLRDDERFARLLRDMELVVPCHYNVGTLGLPSPLAGELDLSGEDATVFRHEGGGDGAVTIPWASIYKLELQRPRGRARDGDGTLMIRYKEPPARYHNAGFVTRTRGVWSRPWSSQTLRVLEERSGRRVEMVAG